MAAPKKKAPPDESMRENARKAVAGDKEALSLVIMVAPRGLHGMSPEDYAQRVAEHGEEEPGEGPPFAKEVEDEAVAGSADRETRRLAFIAGVLSRYGVASADVGNAAMEILDGLEEA